MLKSRILLQSWTIPVLVAWGALPAWGDWVRCGWNAPGETRSAKVGLWSFPAVVDLDGDGAKDLLVQCPDKPNNGLYFFRNAGGPGEMDPVFEPPMRLGPSLPFTFYGDVVGGRTVLWAMRPGGGLGVNWKPTLSNVADIASYAVPKGLEKPVTWGGANTRCTFVDFDGDGELEIVHAGGSGGCVKWDKTYDADGTWPHPKADAAVLVFKKMSGSGLDAVYSPKIFADVKCTDGKRPYAHGRPAAMFADWDGDGDLDMVCGEFIENFRYFENVGTRQNPKYAPGRLLKSASGKLLTMATVMPTPSACDWDGDGRMDIVSGDEDGRIAWFKCTGEMREGMPVFKDPQYFRQRANWLGLGCLTTPYGVDWDGDGDWDFVCGDAAGHVLFLENQSGANVAEPKFARPVCLGVRDGGDPLDLRYPFKKLRAEGWAPKTDPIRVTAGDDGSIQGPSERGWGYTALSVADWDGDGFLDVMVNSIWGKVVWFRNPGRKGALKLEAPQDVDVEWEGPQPTLGWGWLTPEKTGNPKGLLTRWRTTPMMVDWNRDGLTDLVMMDHAGYLAFFERARAADGRLVLKAPRRIFVDEKGEPLFVGLFNEGVGRSGRTKLLLADCNGDGRLDLVRTCGANAAVFLGMGEKDGAWVFGKGTALGRKSFAGHDNAPAAADFDGDGRLEIYTADEGGFFWRYD